MDARRGIEEDDRPRSPERVAGPPPQVFFDPADLRGQIPKKLTLAPSSQGVGESHETRP
jgi:hypothetical protein